MQMYGDLFSQFNQKTAQVLLTRTDIADRKRYMNGKNTLTKLLSLGIIPIVNENDTVSVMVAFSFFFLSFPFSCDKIFRS